MWWKVSWFFFFYFFYYFPNFFSIILNILSSLFYLHFPFLSSMFYEILSRLVLSCSRVRFLSISESRGKSWRIFRRNSSPWWQTKQVFYVLKFGSFDLLSVTESTNHNQHTLFKKSKYLWGWRFYNSAWYSYRMSVTYNINHRNIRTVLY